MLAMLASMPDPRVQWLPVVLLLAVAIIFCAVTIFLSKLIGPSRTGSVKERVYESGMVPVGDARRRFNVRFYLVAMIFLVFDVEIVFFYPWASIFPQAVNASGLDSLAARLLISMLVFILILVVAYLYAWGKGVFKWD